MSVVNPNYQSSPATPVPSSRTRDRRSRHTFWIDDRVIDDFGPVMGQFAFGATALAVYMVLARTADREGDSWPSLRLLQRESAASERTVQRAIRLLELLGLIEVASCYEEGSRRQTSNLYTLLTPPEEPPEIDPDPTKWPAPARSSVLVRSSTHRREAVAAARVQQRGFGGVGAKWAGPFPVPEGGTPRNADTFPPVTLTPPRRQPDTPSPVTLTPREGNPSEGTTWKEGSRERTTNERAPEGSFTIEEIGLTNRQVWAAALGELTRQGEVARTDLESWLRPAALIGRDGQTLILGAPNAVTRDRIASRLLPAVRDALGATIGVPVDVSVVVAGERRAHAASPQNSDLRLPTPDSRETP